MERNHDCYFVVAILEIKDGDIALVSDCVDYLGYSSSGSLVVVYGRQYLKHLGSWMV